MTQEKQKTNHAAFLELMGRIKFRRYCGDVIVITDEEADLILAEGEWLKDFVEAGRRNAKLNENPGRKKLPDSEIKPESLKRRQKRAEAKMKS